MSMVFVSLTVSGVETSAVLGASGGCTTAGCLGTLARHLRRFFWRVPAYRVYKVGRHMTYVWRPDCRRWGEVADESSLWIVSINCACSIGR